MPSSTWVMTLATALFLVGAAPAAVNAQGASAGVRANQQHDQRAGARARRAATEWTAERARAAERERAAEQARTAERARGAEWERAAERARRAEVDRRRDVDRRSRDRAVYGRQQQQGGSPAFCRSGSGHPVFGRQWCREKGFSLGGDRRDAGRAGDVILRRPRD
jgi:hypothetical protein